MSDTPHSEQGYGKYDLGLKSFIKSLKIAFFAMVILIIGLLIYFFGIKSFIIVEAQENVLVLRFGKLMEVLDQNWYWRLPRPINELVRIKLNQQTFMVDFEAMPTPNQGPEGPQGQPLEPGRDSYLITGDINIIHTTWKVDYKVTDAKRYYEYFISAMAPFVENVESNKSITSNLYSGGPVMSLRNILKQVAIKETAIQKVDQTLYNNQKYTEQVKNKYKKAVADLMAGITIENVSLLKYTPPLKAKAAFDEVSSAQQQKDSEVNKALAYQVETKNAALSEAAITRALAQNYKKRIVAEVKAETIYFDSIKKEYDLSPETVLVSLYNNTLGDVLSVVKDKYILYKGGPDGRQEVRLKINTEPKDVKKK